MSLGERGHRDPQRYRRRRQPDADGRLARRSERPAERGTKIIDLGRIHSGDSVGIGGVARARVKKLAVIPCVAPRYRIVLAAVGELYECIRAGSIRELQARLGLTYIRPDQRLCDQIGDKIDEFGHWVVSIGRDGACGVEREAAGEDRQPVKDRLLASPSRL